MRLAHLHIPRLLPYYQASRIQEALIQKHFRYKDLLRTPSTPLPPPLSPTILTFSTPPTYTVGRRYLPSLATPQDALLPKQSDYTVTQKDIEFLTGSPNNLATFHPSSRGGLLTYHAPGQLTAYPIINLRNHALTPKCYVRHLESTIIRTCTALGVSNVATTSDPGVWIKESNPPRKICAVGVQIRRGITGHGVGLNVRDAVAPEDYKHADGMKAEGYLSWGFGRIVACGLEGKGVTWLSREGMTDSIGTQEVADVLVEEFAKALDSVEGVYKIDEKDTEL
jgi:lipoyl(octanoyl) transferase 2